VNRNLRLALFRRLPALIARVAAVTALLAAGSRPAVAAEAAASHASPALHASPDFERQILPLLYNRCFSCHSEKVAEPKADLRLDSAASILESGAIVPGKPDDSEVLRRVSLPHTDEGLMPPLKGGGLPLNETERALVRTWIAEGAEFGTWQRFDHREPAIDYRATPLKRTDVPELTARFDRLVDDYHRTRGTKLNAPLTDEVFLRRVYLDVAGRIPSPEESDRFLQSTAPDKRARLIDELLDGEGYVSHTFNWKADQLRLVTKGFPGQPGWIYDEWVREAIRSRMPYDEFVRRLVTAEGYLWENGAVGFYLRDLGMPLDHMSNLTRVFLGTRIECAQCHDHPFEPITQKDFYGLAAYTFGVSNLYSSAGYSTDNVRHWDALQAQLNTMDAPEALRQAVSETVAPLKRLTRDTENRLTFPETYAEPALRGKPVEMHTPFGDQAPATLENRRQVLADWMTSPRNPRFARNIANRLFKRVMGIGLIEPVDSLSPVNRPEQPELLAFLAEATSRLGFDERAVLAVMLNSRLYQSESDRQEWEPGRPFALRGPLLRRLSAEQLWDSILVLLVEDLDERKPLDADQEREIRARFNTLTHMTADELMERSKVWMEFRKELRRHALELDEQKAAVAEATKRGDAAEAARLTKEHLAKNEAFDRRKNEIYAVRLAPTRETDPRWVKLAPSLIRASELPIPIALGHFLRQFGQSDRREIDAFNRDPNITHSLALMNGELTKDLLEPHGYLRQSVASVTDDDAKVRALFQAILVRRPTAGELEQCRGLLKAGPTAEADLIWALVNSPEFLFLE
jgi:hypothetical protein